MPSQKQLKWSQLRVGITVILASLILAFLLYKVRLKKKVTVKKLLVRYLLRAVGVLQPLPIKLIQDLIV